MPLKSSSHWAVLLRSHCSANKGADSSTGCQSPVDSSHGHIDKDSAAEWFSHMLANVLFHMAQPRSIPHILRGVVYDVCTPWFHAKCASQQAERSNSFCKCLAYCSGSESILSFLHHALILQDFLHSASIFLWKMKPFLWVYAWGSEVVSYPGVSARSQFHLIYCFSCGLLELVLQGLMKNW